MRVKARKELEEWEEKVKRQKNGDRRTASTQTDDVSGDAEQSLVFEW